jgi:hypothetical protein
MNKFHGLIAFLAVLSASGFASAQSEVSVRSVLDHAISATDGQLAPAFAAALDNAVAVPVPAAPARTEVAAEAADLYFPLRAGAVYNYDYTSSEFDGIRHVRLEYIHYSEKDHAISVLKTVTYDGASRNELYGVHANAKGVYATGGIISGRRMEFPLPLEISKNWSESADLLKVDAIDARVQVPAGNFGSCLKISSAIGGAAARGERYYAPGVGLVYEEVISGTGRAAVKLVSYDLD